MPVQFTAFVPSTQNTGFILPLWIHIVIDLAPSADCRKTAWPSFPSTDLRSLAKHRQLQKLRERQLVDNTHKPRTYSRTTETTSEKNIKYFKINPLDGFFNRFGLCLQIGLPPNDHTDHPYHRIPSHPFPILPYLSLVFSIHFLRESRIL
jgi:hypothetical protein